MMTNTSGGMLHLGRVERLLMLAFLIVLALIWSVPLISAIARGFAFNGIRNFTDVIFNEVGDVSLLRTYLNSFIVAFFHASLVVFVAALAGYGFTYFEFPAKNIAYFGVLVFMAVPLTSILIPLFYLARTSGLRDSLVGIALPEAAMTLPFGVLLVRNFAESIPRTFIESALIDGASHPKAFWTIFVPLARPALINLGALSIMWSLQDFLLPSLFLTNADNTTAAQAVMRFKEYLTATPDDIGRYNASLVLLAVPALLIILFGLRFITTGLTAGGVKE